MAVMVKLHSQGTLTSQCQCWPLWAEATIWHALVCIATAIHWPLKHGSVRGLGWSIGVKVPGIQTEKVSKSSTVHTRCTYEAYIRSTNVTTDPI
jgi:hypothetical protein